MGGFFLFADSIERPHWCGIFYASDLELDDQLEFGSLHGQYHHLVFDKNHNWGSLFGVGGTLDPESPAPSTWNGLFLNHPTLAANPYEICGSSH